MINTIRRLMEMMAKNTISMRSDDAALIFQNTLSVNDFGERGAAGIFLDKLENRLIITTFALHVSLKSTYGIEKNCKVKTNFP
jgi:hypothetical protein